jgi:hypothetical protein
MQQQMKIENEVVVVVVVVATADVLLSFDADVAVLTVLSLP